MILTLVLLMIVMIIMLLPVICNVDNENINIIIFNIGNYINNSSSSK